MRRMEVLTIVNGKSGVEWEAFYRGWRKEKIGGTYFKIQGTYFEIGPTFFQTVEKRLKRGFWAVSLCRSQL